MSKSSGISDLACVLLSFNLFLRGSGTNWGHYTSNLANIATISLVCIQLLVVSICQGVHRKQQRINDSLFAAYHPSLSSSLSLEDCWATAPAVMPVWLHESHEQRVCRQCCIAAISKLPALPSPMGYEGINPLTYFAFAGLAACQLVCSQ